MATDPEYQEILLTKVAYMSPKDEHEVLRGILQEFNTIIPISGFTHNNRRALVTCFRLLEAEVLSTLPVDVLVLVLGAVQRLLFAKAGFDEVSLLRLTHNSTGFITQPNKYLHRMLDNFSRHYMNLTS